MVFSSPASGFFMGNVLSSFRGTQECRTATNVVRVGEKPKPYRKRLR